MPRKRLTQESVRKLNPVPGTQVSYFDAGMPGLVLWLNPGGTKTWSALFYASGKPRYKKLGRYPVLSLAQARDAARKFLENPQKALSETEAGTFKDVSDNFMKRYVEANGLRSKREIARTLNKYILPRWQDRKICDIRRSDVTALLDKVEDDHGARQADMVLAVVRKMMNWHASRHDDYVSPIARNMNRVKAADRARKRVLEDDELRAVWHACDELSTFGALVKFALLTAQRKEKIATLRWDDIADGVWAIRTEPREKGNAGRLRLPQVALDIIAAQPRIEGNPYVFTAARGVGPFNSFSEWKAQLDAKLPADLAHWTIHDLRRTARSLLSRAGVRPDISERVMGHAIPGVEGVYDRHRYDDEKAHALQALADLIDRILNPPAANVVPLRAGATLATPSDLGREAVVTPT